MLTENRISVIFNANQSFVASYQPFDAHFSQNAPLMRCREADSLQRHGIPCNAMPSTQLNVQLKRITTVFRLHAQTVSATKLRFLSESEPAQLGG